MHFNNIILVWIYFSIFSENLAVRNKKHPRQNFGKYKVVIDEVTKCSVLGPIHEGVFDNLTVNVVKNGNKQYIYANGKSNETYQIISAFYMTDIYEDGKFQKLMKKNVTNPCSNELFKHTANNIYNGMINENCTVSKGNFNSGNIDINAMVHKLLGNNFFHTKMNSTVQYYSPKGVTFCTQMVAEIKPLILISSIKKT